MKRLLVLLLLMTLTACFDEKKSGPVDIQWGREMCEQCGMIIDDPRFAAEVRDDKNKIHKFDDVGDAVLWLAKNNLKADAVAEVWVGNMDTGKWMDARAAHFVRVRTSPMGHGFGAVTAPREGTLTFAEMQGVVLAKGNPELCAFPDKDHKPEDMHDHSNEHQTHAPHGSGDGK